MDELLAVTLRAAEAAAAVHMSHFGQVRVDTAREKAQSDFVTQVDLEAQAAAISVIRGSYPDHLILAEEEPEDGDAAGLVTQRAWPADEGHLWIIDPLDGTTNYLHRHPLFGASVAVGRLREVGAEDAAANPGLTLHGCLEAGAVVAPRTHERWWARRGGGAWKNGLRLAVSGIRALPRALVGTGFPFKEPEIVPRYAEQLKRVLPRSGGIRRGGSAALDLCFLAEGLLDAFWEEDYLSPWDTAAGLLILSEAGGVASRMDGSAITLEEGSVLAGNSADTVAALGRLLEGNSEHA